MSQTTMAARAARGTRSRSGADPMGSRSALCSAASSSGTLGRKSGSITVVRSAGSSTSRPAVPYSRCTRVVAILATSDP